MLTKNGWPESNMQGTPPMTEASTPRGVASNGRVAPDAHRRDMGSVGRRPERAEVAGWGATKTKRPRLPRGRPVRGPHRLPLVRDLPAWFGRWDAVYQRFRRWEKAGWWRALFERLPADLQAVHTVFFDSSVVRAHPHAAGVPKTEGSQQGQALGRSRGGFGIKIHVAAADESTTLAVVLTPGQSGDAPTYPEVIDAVPEECPVTSFIQSTRTRRVQYLFLITSMYS